MSFTAILAIVNVAAIGIHISNAITESRRGYWPVLSLVGVGVSACLATYFGIAAFR